MDESKLYTTEMFDVYKISKEEYTRYLENKNKGDIGRYYLKTKRDKLITLNSVTLNIGKVNGQVEYYLISTTGYGYKYPVVEDQFRSIFKFNYTNLLNLEMGKDFSRFEDNNNSKTQYIMNKDYPIWRYVDTKASYLRMKDGYNRLKNKGVLTAEDIDLMEHGEFLMKRMDRKFDYYNSGKYEPFTLNNFYYTRSRTKATITTEEMYGLRKIYESFNKLPDEIKVTVGQINIVDDGGKTFAYNISPWANININKNVLKIKDIATLEGTIYHEIGHALSDFSVNRKVGLSIYKEPDYTEYTKKFFTEDSYFYTRPNEVLANNTAFYLRKIYGTLKEGEGMDHFNQEYITKNGITFDKAYSLIRNVFNNIYLSRTINGVFTPTNNNLINKVNSANRQITSFTGTKMILIKDVGVVLVIEDGVVVRKIKLYTPNNILLD